MSLAEQQELATLVASGDAEANRRALLALPAGIHHRIDEEVYHARVLGMANKGGLDKLLESPAVHKAWCDGLIEDETTPALEFGKLFHRAVLEPVIFAGLAPPAKALKRSVEAWHERMTTIDAMRSALLAHPLVGSVTVGDLLEGGADTEVTARWTDQETGLECKARGDIWVPHAGVLLDVKTVSARAPTAESFSRTCGDYAYHRQHPWYVDGWAALGAPVDRFLFAVVSKAAPHLCAVYELDPEDVDMGRRTNRRALRLLSDCIAKDQWPRMPGGIQPLRLKPWITE